jgi:hypothetical protein
MHVQSKLKQPKALLILAAAMAFTAAPAGADDYSAWGHTRDLYTLTSADGAFVTSTVKNFPLLVRLDTGNFAFAEALGRGQDLRFSDPAGKHLPYQIERWDSTGAKAEIWVKLDSVVGNASTLALRMHWGKGDAADSSNGSAVFDSADGFVAAWHLGGADTLARANAVAGGNPATPKRYDGDESRAGMIGLADSLDGAGDGDYLDLGQGYAELNKGFTFSMWINPSSRAFWSRLLDMGNGAPQDNLVLQRHVVSDDLDYDQYNGTVGAKRVTAVSGLVLDEWQQFTVTVGDKIASLYRNGVLVASEKQVDTIPAVTRMFNYIGKSNWQGNSYFQGKIDEARMAKKALSADWIKLSYANQNAAQNLLSHQAPTGPGCTAHFDVPMDTTVKEGTFLELAGTADCADSYLWTLVSGPGPRILDPEVRALQIAIPRVTRDMTVKYRFSARYGATNMSKEVSVLIDEAIPDPTFTLPATMAWNGKDSLLYKPKLTNLAAIQASKDSVINWSWTFSGTTADTAWRDAALMLKSSTEGELKIGLCLDNGGAAVCKSALVNVGPVTGLHAVPAEPMAPARKAFDAGGRRVDADALRRTLSTIGFFR